jgi:hypothetical protein
VIEPMVYGHSTGLSPVAVVVSATFWTALWGPIGLVLATPLTVCLVVLGRHVERLEFLDVMFGDRPALSPSEIFYQRMLARDPTEAAEQAEEFLKERPLSAYYDEIALVGLQLAQADATRGVLDEVRQAEICGAVRELVADLANASDGEPENGDATINVEAAAAVEAVADAASLPTIPVLRIGELRPEWRGERAILCTAGRTALDEAAATMFVQLVSTHGVSASVESAEALSTANIFRLDGLGVALVCLSYLDASSPAHMRYSVRRLRRKLPNATIMLGCWSADKGAAALEQLREAARADIVAGTLREATRLCVELAGDVPAGLPISVTAA